jgi:hypothetical protein
MSNLAELVQRTDQLQGRLDLLRSELEDVRKELARYREEGSEDTQSPAATATDCLGLALKQAEDLGAGFAAADPHGLAGRGDDWFGKQ